MTLNNEVFHRTSAEVNTQIGSYFDVVDNCISMSDTNKKYVVDPQSSYSPGPPIQANSFTTFIISPTCDNTADIYNGFITAKLHCKFNLSGDALPAALTTTIARKHFDRMWVGFKDAMDAVEKYEILSNGISIYTQNFAPEESFITSCTPNELVKKADVYSKVRHKDVWYQKHAGCGAFIDWGVATTVNDVVIPLKIDLRRFLPLSNIKYLPAFAGKFELRIMFGTQGMVYTPCGPEKSLVHDIRTMSTCVLPEITCEFKPIGEEVTCYATAATAGGVHTFTAEQRTVTVDRQYYTTATYSVIPNFGIDNDVYQKLVTRYQSQEFIIPTQVISINPMANVLGAGKGSSTTTQTPQFIDSHFLLFPLKPNYHTVFKNPGFTSCQLKCGGYGSIPNSATNTVDDPTFIELCQNALNVNGGQVGFNKDVLESLTHVGYGADANATRTLENDTYPHDRTNFLIGLPTETDNTFQQGQTSKTPITYEFASNLPNNYYSTLANHPPPLLCFLQDHPISIHVLPNGQPPVVEIGPFDVTSRS